MSTDNLQFLSSEQALADLASFIGFAKEKYGLKDNKWIAFGGSYSGEKTTTSQHSSPTC